MKRKSFGAIKKGTVCWGAIVASILPVAAQTWQPVGKATGAPVVTPNTACNSSVDTVGTTTDRSVLLTCQSNVWKIPKAELANCTLPWGGTIASGASATAYASDWVQYGGSCAAQTRACNNGTLSGSYNYSSCSPLSGASCSLPWGGSIADGSSVEAYQAETSSNCSSQVRSCSDGYLSGSYQYFSCSAPSIGAWSTVVLSMDWDCYSWQPAGSAKSGSCSPVGSTHTYYSYGAYPERCGPGGYIRAIWTQTCE